MSDIAKSFKFNGKPFRVTGSWESPTFHLPDLCKILGLGNPSRVAARLPKDEVVPLTQSKGLVTNFVNEAGLYRVIFRSNKPEALDFQKWVFSEVLPSIRKTGMYQRPRLVPVVDPAIVKQVYEAKERLKARIDSLDVDVLSQDMSAFMAAYRAISELLWGKSVNAVMANLGLLSLQYEVSSEWWKYLSVDNQVAFAQVVGMAATWLDSLTDAHGEIKRHGEAWMHSTGFVPPTLLKGTVKVTGTPFPLFGNQEAA